jgi:hypothetical protein
MEDVGIPSTHSFEICHHFDRRSAEKRKPIEIVGIVDPAILIEPWSIKEGLVPNRPYSDPAITLTNGKNTFLNWRINKPFRRRYSYSTDGMERSASLTQATIVREKENDIMAKPRQLKRQRAGNIGKPTGLRIRDRFRGDYEQVQRMLGHGEPRSSFDITSPDEESEVWPDARSEAWKNCRRIR